MIAASAVCGVAAIALIGAAAWGLILKNTNTIFPNVQVAGVDVGGMTAAEAKSAVESSVARRYNVPLELQLPDTTLVLEPEQVAVSLNADSAVSRAMAHGRESHIFAAVLTRLRGMGSPQDISLDSALNLNTDYIRQVLQDAAAKAAIPAVQPRTTHDRDTGALVVTMGTDGQILDVQSLYDTVLRSLEAGDLSPIVWDYTTQLCGIPDLDTLFSDIHVEPVDAYYDAEARAIVDGKPGISFDLDAAKSHMNSTPPGESFEIPIGEVPPAITAESLNAEMFGDKLESRSGPYQAYLTNRTNNLILACEAINGTILNPGDVFSFNEVVGERTKERGYLPATVYVSSSETGSDYGGGVCQVASVIYYTTLHLNLKQVERHPHVFTVTYVPYGMDAGIYWSGNQDYKFENTLSHPIKLQAVADGSSVVITIWGVKESDNYVKMTYQVLETYAPEVVEVVDETKPYDYRQQTEKPQQGCKVVAVRTEYDADGNVVSTSSVYSTYKKKDERWVVGAPSVPEEDWDPDNWFDPEIDDPLLG